MPSLLKRILVVDDDDGIGVLIRAALPGYTEVNQVVLGSQASAAAAAFKPDLILLDLHMPNINGYEVLRQLKKNPEIAGIPVISMTSDPEDASRARASELGAIGCLLKPLHVTTLGPDLTSLLETASTTLESPSQRGKVIVAFNGADKSRRLKQEVMRAAAMGEKVVILTLSRGEAVCDYDLEQLVRVESVVFLQIQPSLVVKFPYLVELSPILAEIKSFLEEEPRNYTLIFDDVLAVLHAQDGEAAMARAYALHDALSGIFDWMVFLFNRDGTSDGQLLNRLAKVFAR